MGRFACLGIDLDAVMRGFEVSAPTPKSTKRKLEIVVPALTMADSISVKSDLDGFVKDVRAVFKPKGDKIVEFTFKKRPCVIIPNFETYRTEYQRLHLQYEMRVGKGKRDVGDMKKHELTVYFRYL